MGMPAEPDGVVTTVVLVLFITTATATWPIIEPSSPGRSEPLRVENASIGEDISLVKADFGAGTYHFTSVTVDLYGVSGGGTVVIQIGIPRLRNNLVLTETVELRSREETNRTIRFQPSIEFHPIQLGYNRFPTRITVRVNSGGETQIVAERTVEIDVVPPLDR